jgi:hypothetical protein
MTRNSTPRAFKHCKNSLKSLVKDLGSIIELAPRFQVAKPLQRRLRKPEVPVLQFCLGMGTDPKLRSINPG